MPSNKQMVLGLTGGIGSGKSTAAAYLREKGFTHIDADAISRSLTADGSPMLAVLDGHFGPNSSYGCRILTEDGRLDRRAMADLVFHDPVAKQTLEDLMFVKVRAEIERRIASALQPVLLDVPLLIEAGMTGLCDHVLLLTADRQVRIDRVCARDHCSPEDVDARMRNQMSDADKAAAADFIVDNSQDLSHLQAQLDAVLAQILPQLPARIHNSDEKS